MYNRWRGLATWSRKVNIVGKGKRVNSIRILIAMGIALGNAMISQAGVLSLAVTNLRQTSQEVQFDLEATLTDSNIGGIQSITLETSTIPVINLNLISFSGLNQWGGQPGDGYDIGSGLLKLSAATPGDRLLWNTPKDIVTFVVDTTTLADGDYLIDFSSTQNVATAVGPNQLPFIIGHDEITVSPGRFRVTNANVIPEPDGLLIAVGLASSFLLARRKSLR